MEQLLSRAFFNQFGTSAIVICSSVYLLSVVSVQRIHLETCCIVHTQIYSHFLLQPLLSARSERELRALHYGPVVFVSVDYANFHTKLLWQPPAHRVNRNYPGSVRITLDRPQSTVQTCHHDSR